MKPLIYDDLEPLSKQKLKNCLGFEGNDLSVWWTQFNEDNVKHILLPFLQKNSGVNLCIFGNCCFDDKAFELLLTQTQLSEIKFSSEIPESEQALKALTEGNVPSLGLNSIKLNLDMIKAVANNQKVVALDVTCNIKTRNAEFFSELTKSQSIEILILEYNKLSKDCALPLAQNNKIKTLNIASCYIDDEFISMFQHNTALETLILSSNMLTDKGAENFPFIPTLKELDVRYNKMSEQGIATLKKLYPNILLKSDGNKPMIEKLTLSSTAAILFPKPAEYTNGNIASEENISLITLKNQ